MTDGMRNLTRRRFLAGTGGVAASTLIGGALAWRANAAEMPHFVTSIRSLTNPYHAVWKDGADAFSKAMGAESTVLVTEGNSEKGLSDIRAIIARTGGKMILNVDPNDTPDARPIVEECNKAGVHVVTHWNKPTDLHPWDFNPYYVDHIEFDGVWSGVATAEILFKAMGGKGGFIALGGVASQTAAILRTKGLKDTVAKNPDIEMLDFQEAHWNSNEAYDLTSSMLTRFGDGIKGIWAMNDNMAIGALEALRNEGLAGQIPITGIDGAKAAVEGVKAGELACTISWDPFWSGAMGLSIAYHAQQGKFDPAKEPPEHRKSFGTGILVTADNVAEFYKNNVEMQPQLDYDDLWGRVTGQIPS